MRQGTRASASFDKHSKQTRRAKFLAEIDQVVPWRELCAVVERFYPRAGNGRPPIGLERMLRLHFLQHWFNLSDPAAEEALYASLSMRRFVGIDLGRERVPGETTILNFRHRGAVDEVERGKNRTKSKVRAKVEHPFLIIKRRAVSSVARLTGDLCRCLQPSLSQGRICHQILGPCD